MINLMFPSNSDILGKV